MSISERFAFFSQVRGNFEETGGIQPSSRYLAESMAAPLRRFRLTDANTPVRILEIGPGTGAITRAICTCMGPQDKLDCYEINEEFVRYLGGAIHRDEILAVTEQGTATLFEYVFFPALRRAFAQRALRTRLREAQSEKSQWLTRCGRNSMLVLRNLPPARIHEYGPFIDY